MTDSKYHIVEKPSDILLLQQPGTFRLATGDPNGLRSLTWVIVGSQNSDDVYVGTRGLMGAAKLSLHQSGCWRLAFTKEGAKKLDLPEGEDRLIERYEVTTELAPGWVHAARIRTPSTTFRQTFNEKRPEDKQPIRFYRAPDPPYHLEYHVVLGDADAKPAIVKDMINVGQMTLMSGRRVLIIATFWTMDEITQQLIDTARESVANGAPGNTGFACGSADGIPILVDLAALVPVE